MTDRKRKALSVALQRFVIGVGLVIFILSIIDQVAMGDWLAGVSAIGLAACFVLMAKLWPIVQNRPGWRIKTRNAPAEVERFQDIFLPPLKPDYPAYVRYALPVGAAATVAFYAIQALADHRLQGAA
ncbi:MAG: hypothetical protein AAF376_15665 [Pseudomonadota bacterium]